MKKNDFLSFFYFLQTKNIFFNFYKKNIIILKALQIKKKYIIFEGNLKSESFVNIKEFIINEKLEIKEGDYLEFLLLNIENNYGKIVVSRLKFRDYIFWKNSFISFRKKKFIKGNVSNRIKGGYSVIFKNFKCFLPFSCSDKKISNVFYYLNKDLYFLILNVDILKKNIILSRKLVISKIINIKRKLFFKYAEPGNIVKGIVKNITNYCVFIDIGYLDCVIFFKDLIWGNYRYSNELLHIGQSIIAIILKIDKLKFRIFLGIKQIFNPWKKNFYKNRYLKYARIVRVNTNSIHFVLSKNIIVSTKNFFGKKVFKLFKINRYKKIIIRGINRKKKRDQVLFFIKLKNKEYLKKNINKKKYSNYKINKKKFLKKIKK